MNLRIILRAAVALLVALEPVTSAAPTGTAFTYQGRLAGGGEPSNGHFDLRFRLYDAEDSGNPIGSLLTSDNLKVNDGVFSVPLDFGAGAFDGGARWLQIEVRPAGVGDFVQLTPRQPINPAPYALFAASGNPGPQGAKGDKGDSGATGPAGPKGDTGPAGLKGDKGDVGATGPQGLKGDAGATGATGAQGPAGAKGDKGDVGLQGIAGAEGPQGPKGDKGDKGETGLTGPAGAQGAPGATGPKGDTGLTGAAGPQGPKGDTGATGPTGPLGAQGPAGATGPAGLQGPIGLTGPIGPQGSQGPAGATGPTGPQGLPGAAGPRGLTWRGAWSVATSYAKDDAVSHNGASWMAKAANTGSTPAGGSPNWDLFADKGATGAQGIQGVAGVQGVQGSKGDTGSTGSQGPPGAKGDKGDPGIQGPPGLPGSADAWSRTGNAGTDPNNNFIGTTDNQSFVVKVNGQGALRLQPKIEDPNHSDIVNVTAGSPLNAVFLNVYGGTIAGGGSGEYDSVGGANYVSGDFGTVGGGLANRAEDSFSTVAGGHDNVAEWEGATVSGGGNNSASEEYATIAGGRDNVANGVCSFAAGQRAHALHDGAFVWADGIGGDFTSAGNNTFCVRAGGGVHFHPNTAVAFGNQTRQMLNLYGTPGSGYGIGVQDFTLYFRSNGTFSWFRQGAHIDIQNHPGTGTELMRLESVGDLKVKRNLVANAVLNTSDRNAKENFAPINPGAVLDKVIALPLSEWSYKADKCQSRHLGPMAQDFKAAFNLGEDDKHIATVDADGVALAAIQGLNQKLEAKLKEKDAMIAQLERRLAALEKHLSSTAR